MLNKILDVESKNLPASYFLWKKTDKKNERKVNKRFIKEVNETISSPIKFYKRIL